MSEKKRSQNRTSVQSSKYETLRMPLQMKRCFGLKNK